ncbi:MAG: hypothetical protein IJT45_09745 [Bacteroidales bacterium]|nr:hypothetical protein [Bacteroidales bacterium]
MKKITIILLIFSALTLTTCKKLPELKVYELNLANENVAYSQTSAEITVDYEYPTQLQYVNVTMSRSNYFDYSFVARAEVKDSVLIANFVDLQTDKNYYYKFEYSNGVNVITSDVHSFYLDAALVTLPTVITMEVSEIQGTSAICGGEIIDDGGYYVTGRGVCWSTHRNPTIFDNYTTDGMDTGSYTSTMTGLSEHTVYYVRAFAINEKGTSYGTEYSFETTEGGGVIIAPTVTTSNVTDITSTSAICGGVVANSGGADVTARGVCWSTTENPTISDAHTSDGTGTGTFTSSLTNLTPQTTYYIRAYATNEVGTAYGEQKIFTAGSDITSPTVTTNDVSSVTSNSAVCGGNVTSAGNGTVTERGVCWSISENPTINDSHTNDGTGTGSYTSNITNLIENTTYYVRAFATNEIGTAYGEQKIFTTEQDSPNVPTGAINGLFTINENGDQVWFSQGNLQYQASTNTWHFAENQWNYVGGTGMYGSQQQGNVTGSSNNNISSTYSGWIDLFGWGTSGFNHGAVCYQPWCTSNNHYDYYAYGEPNYNLYDQTGQANWGYNSISNGGNISNLWRALKTDEAEYLLFTRITASGIRFALATVAGTSGLIILPDNWDISTYTLNNTNIAQGASYDNNIITIVQWELLEDVGAVFLPVTGVRRGYSSQYVESLDTGWYWTSSYCDLYGAHGFGFSGPVHTNENYSRTDGCAVRLVRDAE